MTIDRAHSPPREPPTSDFEILDNSYLLEEETFPWYSPDAFYPVRIGEIFQSKYQVLGNWVMDLSQLPGFVETSSKSLLDFIHFLQNLIRAVEIMTTLP
jgi:hypothetical protein